MKGTCGLRCLRATLLSDKFLRLFVVSGRIRLIGYVCVLRGSNIMGTGLSQRIDYSMRRVCTAFACAQRNIMLAACWSIAIIHLYAQQSLAF